MTAFSDPTAVVIPTFNRKPTLLLALSKVFDILPPSTCVIVVDSGSSDGTAAAVCEHYPEAQLVQGDPSMWWAAAVNAGIRRAQALGCRYVLTYNDDNVATPNLFAKLRQASSEAPGSVIAAVCCYLDRPSHVFFAGRLRAKGSDRFFYLDHNAPLVNLGNGLRSADMLHGMCTLFPTTVFEKVGLFEETNFPHAFADDDLLLKARKAGFALNVALEAVVLNDRGKTGLNPYDRRLGPADVLRLMLSRRSSFQLAARTRFLWRYRRSVYYFGKTWICDYCRLLALVVSRWVLPVRTFELLGSLWNHRLQEK